MRIDWTARAVRDIESISEFISRDSPLSARSFLERLFDVVTVLESSPRSGRKVPEVGMDGIREIIFENYRIVYQPGDDVVSILTVFERHRLFRSADLERESGSP